MKPRTLLISGLLLALFAMAGTALVAVTYEETRERIAANERAALLRHLNELVPTQRYDNDPYHDTLAVRDPRRLGSDEPVTVYRVRKEGEPVAAVIASETPDGYSGTIRLLVGVNYDGTLAGVRVLSHRETPGLGDAIEAERSPWIHTFAGRSLSNPREQAWKVKKDGGVFDQFTGATITPRAVVQGVYNTLVYFREQREALFAPGEGPGAEAANGPDEAAETKGEPHD